MSILPLEGIRVVDFGTSVVAPMCARYFSDYGAEVIKVESATRLDRMRYLTPYKVGTPMEEMINIGTNFMDYNRGAKSVLANFKSSEGIDLIKKLIAKSDVVIENFSPRVMKGLGLGYEDLKKIKPDIIMLSLSAVGQEGPLHDLMTWGPTLACVCGVQSMCGYPDGEPAQDYASADFNAACQGAFMILSALWHRYNTGEGQYIDMGQAAPHVYNLGEALMDYSMNKRVPGMVGNRRPGFVPYSYYRCKPDPRHPVPTDMWVSIAVETEEEWESLCDVMGNPEWTKDDKFADRAKRWENQEELDSLITEWTKDKTGYEIMFLLQKAGVASAPCLHATGRMVDPHFLARQAYRPLDVGNYKGILFQRQGLNLSEVKEEPWAPPPKLGEHCDYVYREILGLSKEEIASLVDKKAIA